MAQRPTLPGPTGVPVLGSSHRYASNPLRFLEQVEASYNGIASFNLGPSPTCMVTDPEAIGRILVENEDQYRKPDFQSDQLGALLGDGLLLSEGETWQRQRELANPAFRMARLAEFDERIGEHAHGLLAEWEAGEQVDVERAMTEVTIRVIADLMLGVELTDRQLRTLEENLEPLGARFEPDVLQFAWPTWLPMPGDRPYQAAVDEVDTVVEEIIASRDGTYGDDSRMDLLSVLLRARDDGEQSPQQLRDEVMTMLLAGHDTTALTLAYTWYLLSEHPEKRRRFHEEVDAVDGPVTIDDVRSFEYIEWCVDEAMRLYPPVYLIFREATEDVEILGYDIPAETILMLPQWAVHRSPSYWDEPTAFRPERWRPEQRRDRQRFAYFPFGGGSRHCIGKHLAKLEAQIILATLAREYEFEYAGDADALSFRPSLTLHPEGGLPMRLHRR